MLVRRHQHIDRIGAFEGRGKIVGVGRIGRKDFYAVEKEARGRMPEERLHLRRHRAVAIFDELETWLHAQLPKIPGKSELAKAIH